MKQFDVLDPKTDVFRHYFLEASAGTGKTFAIENIVPRLLLKEEGPLKIEEILVVTFTRAATRELKSRIYQNLLKIMRSLDADDEAAPFIEEIRLKGEGALDRAKKRMEEALCFFERAEVFTLHGFCLKILQEFALSAQFVLGAKEEELIQTRKLKQYIKDFLRRGIDPKVISPSQLQKVVSSQKKEIEFFCDQIVQKLQSGDLIRSYPTAFSLWNSWRELLHNLPTVSKRELWHDFSLLSLLAKSKKRKLQADQFFEMIEKRDCSFEEWDLFLKEEEFFLEEISFEKAYKKKDRDSMGLHYVGLFEILQEQFVPLFRRAVDKTTAFLQLVSLAKPHYEKGRSDLAHFNPDDLVVKLKQALQEFSFRNKVRSKYKAAIIDEFQDTDPLQWDIFETLFLSNEHTIPIFYLVGDPKQSIYAFRRADVYLYLKVASFLGEKSLAYLDTNYRSHPDLVNALNLLFSFDLPKRYLLLPQTNDSLEIRPVKSSLKNFPLLQEDSLGRIHFFLMEDDAGREKKWPRDEVEEKKIFPFMAREMSRLQKELRISFKQMAVLVKDRYQAGRLQLFLKGKNIPCLMQKRFVVAESVAYEGMKDFLLCIEKPSHLSRLKKFLAGPFIGYSCHEIEGFWENEKLQEGREYFMRARHSFRNKGVAVLLGEFLEGPSRHAGKTIAEEMLLRKDSSLYFEIRQLIQIILQECGAGIYDLKTLLQFLEEMKDLPEDSEILNGFLEEEEDQVRVMTVHKSKGLEFEVVFALALCFRHTAKEEYIWIKNKEGREIGATSQEKEDFSLYLQELDAEKLRQLYVALTRAKERVYIPLVLSKTSYKPAEGTAAPIELLLGGLGLSDYSFQEAYKTIEKQSLSSVVSYLNKLQENSSISYEVVDEFVLCEPSSKDFLDDSLLIRPPPFSRAFQSPMLLSFSSLSKEQKEEKERDVLEINEDTLPLGAETGTLIHHLLELICKADLHREKESSEMEKLIKEACLNTSLFGFEPLILDMLQNALRAPIDTGETCFSLSDVKSQEMHIEMEFLYPISDSLLKGFIDMVFLFEGKYYILDWKTNFLGLQKEDYTIEKIKESMEESSYFLQASIYAGALKKYLALFDQRDFEKIFGGAIYFFLRGEKPYFFKPKPSIQEDVICKA